MSTAEARGLPERPKRLSSRLLLKPTDFAPTADGLEVIGVFNPGAARVGDEVVLLVRVAQGSTVKEPGWVHSPRSTLEGGEVHYHIDRLEIHPDDNGDHRKPLTVTGHRRLAFISHLELIRLSADGYEVKGIERLGALFGQSDTEEYGVEDARITQIPDASASDVGPARCAGGDEYLITYVSVSSTMGVATSLMTTRDFKTFERRGVIFETENKDVVIFPEKIGGTYHALHRPVENINIRPLAIMAAESPDLVHWGRHHYVIGCAPEPGWYSRRIGAGPPPVRTDEGWLTIFHGVRDRHAGDPTGAYAAGAVLTAFDEPWRPIAISEDPFLFPEEDWEVTGYVGDVVFPTGTVADLDDPDRLHVYYGCADSCVAVATFSTKEIVAHLKRL